MMRDARYGMRDARSGIRDPRHEFMNSPCSQVILRSH
jgi:hypothetical protein